MRENGETTFCYNQEYLTRTDAAAVSLSLPLREKPFSEEELLPYFKGSCPGWRSSRELVPLHGTLAAITHHVGLVACLDA